MTGHHQESEKAFSTAQPEKRRESIRKEEENESEGAL
jgi:hypothetical protein